MDETLKESDFLLESNRLATFKNWPNPNISPQSLAKAGFYYLNRSDQVKCAWCKGVMAEWEKQDNAFEEHKRFFPNCPRVQLGPHIEISNDAISDLGIQKISPPMKPKYSSLDARLRTYTSWPVPDIQRPESLAEAGLYYQNVDDQVRCFHCNLGLRSWQREDDPWFEHTKWFPQCQFVHLVKGVGYVQQVLARQNISQPTVMTIGEALMTPPVLQALEMGIDGGSIRNATQQKLLCSGRPYDTVEDLIKAVFGDRNDNKDIGASNYCIQGRHVELGEVSPIIPIFDVRAANESFAPSSTYNNSPIDSINAAKLPKGNSTENYSYKNGDISGAQLDKLKVTSERSSENKEKCKSSILSLEEENRKLKDARLCKVCLDDEVGVVFLPCGHLVTCVQCAPGVNLCPMCRTIIKGFVRTYLS